MSKRQLETDPSYWPLPLVLHCNLDILLKLSVYSYNHPVRLFLTLTNMIIALIYNIELEHFVKMLPQETKAILKELTNGQ